jgi:hypothetical protein
MEDYVSQIKLELDGVEIDLVSVEEKEIERRKVANSMHRNGTIKVTGRPGLTVSVLKNVVRSKNIDLSKVDGGTITLVYEDGSRTVYPNVVGLKRNPVSYDGEKGAELKYEMVSDDPIES